MKQILLILIILFAITTPLFASQIETTCKDNVCYAASFNFGFDFDFGSDSGVGPASGDGFLLETGDFLLLETGEFLLLE